MNTNLMPEAIGQLDDDLLEAHFAEKNALKARKFAPTKRTLIKRTAAIAAALLLVLSLAYAHQYIPVTYPLNYSDGNEWQLGQPSNADAEMAIANKNIWVYYADGNRLKRERVNLPCDSRNVFLTWKHLNRIGDEVNIIKCVVYGNGVQTTETFAGNDVYGYRPGDHYTMYVVVSDQLNHYLNEDNRELLIESLKKTFLHYSGVDVESVNLVLQESDHTESDEGMETHYAH